jgi:hypothetical protein
VADLRFVELGKLLCTLWVADETLRVGSVVLFAPVTFGLAIVCRLCTAHAAYFFWDAVLDTPPAAMLRIVI